LKPKGLDDGDIDDMHRYFGWYAESPFVLDMKFEKELEKNRRERPLIGQEFATGYPDLDTGLPVWRYTRDLATPLAWVGRWAYPDGKSPTLRMPEPDNVQPQSSKLRWDDGGSNADVFLEHHAIVTKRLAEKLRWERGDRTAGFSLFSAECWFRHSYDPVTVQPYPTLEAAKEFWAPVGLAVETGQRRFYGGDTIKTRVFVTNDDEQFRDLKGLTVTCGLLRNYPTAADVGPIPVPLKSLPYYQTAAVEVSEPVPVLGRHTTRLVTTLWSANKQVISQTNDDIEIFPRVKVPASDRVVKGDVDLSEGSDLRKRIEGGDTVVLMSPGKNLLKQFPDDVLDVKAGTCEFADPSPILGTPLGKDLEPMDVKWWARKGDWKCYVASQSHRLKEGGKARSLLDFVPAHSYISAEKLPDQFRTVLFEIPLGRGRLWVCDLDFNASLGVDPAADLLMRNIQQAAGDPESTAHLPALPSHADVVKAVGRPAQ
jgi:hypothetical protein